jgi:predicted metal-dependent phosphoesterase TrpH
MRSRGSSWYRGDLHLHTVHSDGQYTVEDMVEDATSTGLDFIVSTDHNTSSANRAWAAKPSGDLMVIEYHPSTSSATVSRGASIDSPRAKSQRSNTIHRRRQTRAAS